jgi:hypothetical protein
MCVYVCLCVIDIYVYAHICIDKCEEKELTRHPHHGDLPVVLEGDHHRQRVGHEGRGLNHECSLVQIVGDNLQSQQKGTPSQVMASTDQAMRQECPPYIKNAQHTCSPCTKSSSLLQNLPCWIHAGETHADIGMVTGS